MDCLRLELGALFDFPASVHFFHGFNLSISLTASQVTCHRTLVVAHC